MQNNNTVSTFTSIQFWCHFEENNKLVAWPRIIIYGCNWNLIIDHAMMVITSPKDMAYFHFWTQIDISDSLINRIPVTSNLSTLDVSTMILTL